MSNWNYVWQTSGVPNTGGCGNCICIPTYAASCNSGSCSDILANLDTSITTAAQAFSHYGEQLRRRRGVQFCHTVYTNGQYTWEMPDSTVTMTGAGSFPMDVTYVHGADSGSATFQDIDSAITWLVHKL
jgi:hypothetical protein